MANRKNKREASKDEEIRRMNVPLCMFNSISCAGEVVETFEVGQAFGQEFHTVAGVCDYHREHPPLPKSTAPKPAHELQGKLL